MKIPSWVTKQSVADPLTLKNYLRDWPSLTPIESIRRRLLEQGLTVEDLAHVLGMPTSNVHRLLYSFQNMTLLTLIRLAAGVGLAVDIKLSPFSRIERSAVTMVPYRKTKPGQVKRKKKVS